MDLYEYQGKELFRRYGIPVSEGRLASTPAEARTAAEELGGQVVVKAQVLTGGRGKAGGVKLADGPEEAQARAEEILGLEINGHLVRKLWIESASEIAKEYYLSVTFDRGEKKPLLMLTREGGVEIEQVATQTPERLARLHLDPLEGFQPYQARRLVYGAGIADLLLGAPGSGFLDWNNTYYRTWPAVGNARTTSVTWPVIWPVISMEKHHEDPHRCTGIGQPRCCPGFHAVRDRPLQNDVIVGGKVIGADPDADVRLQLRRDARSEGF